MDTKTISTFMVVALVAFGIAMLIDSRHKADRAIPEQQAVTTAADVTSNTSVQAGSSVSDQNAVSPQYSAIVASSPSKASLGSSEPDSKYMFEVEFSSRGASISRVTLSRFKDRFDKAKQLDLLLPLRTGSGGELLSITTGSLAMLDQKVVLPLEQLDWFASEPVTDADGTQSITFNASAKRADTGEAIRITKTYVIRPGEYHIDCDIKLTNLTGQAYKTRLDIGGPMGIHKEDPRQDDRKVISAYLDPKAEIVTTRLEMRKAKDGQPIEPSSADNRFLWAAGTNKYFTAIVSPVPWEGKTADWIYRITTKYQREDTREGLEGELSFNMRTHVIDLEPAHTAGSEKLCRFQIYLGPKDKALFDSVPLYAGLGFMHTIDFMACCCPTALIAPIAFGILALMKWTYPYIPNYGVIIILLVLLVRLILHPVTKKSQVSMMKMGKLQPKAEEIKKLYADNKEEMNRRLGELYKEAAPAQMLGMLPMFVQMPIWIALYSAIYASIDLRGAPFLPFWITDLSAPDAVLSWTPITLPLLGTFASLNILPMLLAVAMYLQQKLMPQQMAQSQDSSVAQQQKIMMVMMPVMMLLFLYNAPSGLNLYIMASTFGGVIEQKVIRKHIKEREEQESQGMVPVTAKTGGKVKKKKPKPFFKF